MSECQGVDCFVLQDWVSKISWKMQTVLIQGLRAPDTHFCKNVKLLGRWMRHIVFKNADHHHTFMCQKEGMPGVEDLENELNYCSMHCATHLLYAVEIIAYKHNDRHIRRLAFNYYHDLVWGIMHFNIEEEKQLDVRLADVDREPKPAPCPTNDPYISG